MKRILPRWAELILAAAFLLTADTGLFYIPIGDSLPEGEKNPAGKIHGPLYARPRQVIIISMDGLPWLVWKNFILKGNRYEFLQKFARQGFSGPIIPAYPTVTWPAHVTLMTGQKPARHGILGNRWARKKLVFPFDERSVFKGKHPKVPSLFDIAANAGARSAALNWSYSQRYGTIMYNLPEMMYSGDLLWKFASTPMKSALFEVLGGGRNSQWPVKSPASPEYLRTLLGKISAAEHLETDLLVRDLAVHLIRGRRVELTAVHFLLMDTLFHRYGMTDYTAKRALELLNTWVGEIFSAVEMAGQWKDTAFFLVSDHGFLNVNRSVDLKKIIGNRLRPDDYETVYNGHSAFVYARSEKFRQDLFSERIHGDRAAVCIEYILEPSQYHKLGFPSPFYKSGRRRTGVPDLILISKPDCRFSTHGQKEPALKIIWPGNRDWHAGVHGYLPDSAAMHAVWAGMGSGISPVGVLPLTESVNFAPTVAKLMRWQWPENWPPGPKARRFRLDGGIRYEVLK